MRLRLQSGASVAWVVSFVIFLFSMILHYRTPDYALGERFSLTASMAITMFFFAPLVLLLSPVFRTYHPHFLYSFTIPLLPSLTYLPVWLLYSLLLSYRGSGLP